MKLTKGLTLSQFVDEQYEQLKELGHYPLKKCSYPYTLLDLIYSYNNFLKQPLKKEMFVNSEHYALMPPFDDDSDYKIKKKKWEEAESKVIFETFEYWESQAAYSNRIGVTFRKAIFPYGDNIGVIIPKEIDGKLTLVTHFQLRTISDLFKATKGTLEIKNVEL